MKGYPLSKLFSKAEPLPFEKDININLVCSSTMGESIRPSSFHNPMLSANKHVVQNCRSSLSAAADGLADSSGEGRTSPFNGIERSLSRAVVPKTKSLRVSATTFPTACLCTSLRDACERISAIQAVLKGRTVAIRKGNKHQLGLFFHDGRKHKTVVFSQSNALRE